jgi:hypothetical protein
VTCILYIICIIYTIYIQGVPAGMCQTYVKVYRYNPKHLCPNLNGYGDNGQRKVWSSLGFHALYLSADSLINSVLECGVILRLTLALTAYLQSDKVDQTLRDTGSLPSVSCIMLGTIMTTMT